MTETRDTDVDAVVIGAGFAGIYMVHKLRNELGLTVRAFDKAAGVGGTWHWNRYPGALSDTESFVYRYSFDKQLLQQWDWNTRYLTQPEILAYLEEVVDRHDLAKDIQLNTSIDAAEFDEASNTWTVTTDTGQSVTARYVVTALGLLSKTNVPDIKGLDSFQGTVAHTGAWPDGLTLDGKRVGVLGTGSTGTQLICSASKIADHLTVFQRSAQYCVPSGNGPVSQEYVDQTRASYDDVWNSVMNSAVGMGFEESTTPTMSVSAEERERVFQENWDIGNGFRFMFGTFNDIAIDPVANEAAADFIRAKVTQIVTDPETARKLTPTGLYARRPVCNKDYYETYNRPNVSLVSLSETPIVEVTPRGVLTSDGVEHALDVLVFATGFDAVDGNYTRMAIRGRGGKSIQQQWQNGPTGYLGVATAGFPNMFMVLGPHGPFANLPPCIEVEGDLIANLIKKTEATPDAAIEATPVAQAEWVAVCDEIAGYTLFSKVDSWLFGANIPGKANTNMFYMAGLGGYRQAIKEIADADYEGFELRLPRSSVPA